MVKKDFSRLPEKDVIQQVKRNFDVIHAGVEGKTIKNFL